MNTRVGCVPYLNAVPLISELPNSIEVVTDVPAKLPARLASGDVSAILVSSIEALRRPDAVIARGASISSQNEVLSVRLFSKVPFDQIATLALDQSSMTSNMLVQILLAETYGVRPAAQAMPPDLAVMLKEHDAGLLIGDNGMRESGDGCHILDLGEAWHTLTGLPFVWAVWLGNHRFPTDLASHLRESRERGVARLPQIVPDAVRRFGFPEALTARYLSEIMDYDLGESHLAALHEFGKRAQSLGLVEAFQMPRVIGAEPAVTSL